MDLTSVGKMTIVDRQGQEGQRRMELVVVLVLCGAHLGQLLHQIHGWGVEHGRRTRLGCIAAIVQIRVARLVHKGIKVAEHVLDRGYNLIRNVLAELMGLETALHSRVGQIGARVLGLFGDDGAGVVGLGGLGGFGFGFGSSFSGLGLGFGVEMCG